MNYRNFEKNIKDKLYNAEADLDINQFIEELNAKKEKTRRFPFLPFILLGTVIIACSFYMLGKYNNHVVSSSTNLDSNELIMGKSSTGFNTQSNQQLTPSQSLVSEQNPSNISINQAAPTSSDQSIKANATSTPYRDQSYKRLNSYQQKHTNEIAIASSLKDSYITTVNKFQNANEGYSKNHNATFNDEKEINTNEVRNNKLLAGLPLKNQPLFHNATFNIPVDYSKDVQCPTFAKQSNIQFSFIPEVGYFRPLKSLYNNTGESPIVYDLRDKNEKSLEGLQAALYLQVQKKSSPFYLRAGINYAQMTEKMNLQYTYTQRDTSIGIISITVSQTGDTITTIYGEIITETQKKGTKVGHHKFELFDIPVSFGYEKPFGGFKIGAEIGASFNLSMSASGKLLENSIAFKEIALDNPYKSKLGVNYFGSLYISKEVFENQSIYAAIRGRYIPAYLTNSGTAIAEKYSMVGLHLGYKISF